MASTRFGDNGVPIERLDVSAYTVPTDSPESDGTISWNSTTHAHPCCAINSFRHLEYFHDHARIEHMLFDGALTAVKGALWPNLSRPGMGIEFRHADAEKYRVSF